jgi:hypothetical protein
MSFLFGTPQTITKGNPFRVTVTKEVTTIKKTVKIVELKPGDLLLFAGNKTEKSSNLIRIFTRHDITHVAIVVLYKGKIMLLESTVQNDPHVLLDHLTGKKKKYKGVMLVSLEDRIKTYNGKVYVRPLNKKYTEDKMVKYGMLKKDVPFETSKIEFLQAVTSRRLPFTSPDSKFFCSEFLHNMFEYIRWVPLGGNSEYWAPKHFIDSKIGNKEYFYLNKIYRVGSQRG